MEEGGRVGEVNRVKGGRTRRELKLVSGKSPAIRWGIDAQQRTNGPRISVINRGQRRKSRKEEGGANRGDTAVTPVAKARGESTVFLPSLWSGGNPSGT